MPAVSAATASSSRGHISTAAPISLTSHSKAQQGTATLHPDRSLAPPRDNCPLSVSLSSHDV